MSHLSPMGSGTEAPHILLPDSVIRALIADELDRIRNVLEDMGMQLCGDNEIVRSHMNVLQCIDEVCQRNENLARTLRAADMVSETATITLESLRLRMQDAIYERLAEPAAAGDPSGEAWNEI